MHATQDPLAVPNNRFGIHIISPTSDEASSASSLVNSGGGDWGYVTITIEDSDRNHDKWQAFFDALRRDHLIPIVRLATAPEGNFWKVPYEKEEEAWADFLNSLNWPVKNRYVIVYNEPNQAQEWGNQVDAISYAKVLDKTISALKSRSGDFFVMNAGFDASAPEKQPAYEDEEKFLTEMENTVPGIFDRLDGWVSHSYPNPGFAGSPDATGRGTVKNYQWELSVLKSLGIKKDLPVFITETGWKHAEGVDYDKSLPSSSEVGKDLEEAFANAWNDPKIIAVTPFLLDYQNPPFDHFSFRRVDSDIQNLKVLGVQNPSDPNALLQDTYYPQYFSYSAIQKNKGNPIQDDSATLLDSGIYRSIVAGESYTIHLTFQNTGESIWGEKGPVKLVALQGAKELGIEDTALPTGMKIEPGNKYTFDLKLKAPGSGTIKVVLELFNGPNQIKTQDLSFITEVKSPVILVIKAALGWKKDYSGSYDLLVSSPIGSNQRMITLGSRGLSDQVEARDLLPDYSFDFTLEKPFYQGKKLHKSLHSGINTLDFGELSPDIGSVLLNPKELWRLLPFSN